MKRSEYLLTDNHKNHLLKMKEARKASNRSKVEEYNKTPKLCLHCKVSLDYTQKSNTFCGSSCAAKYNNAQKIDPGIKIKVGQNNLRNNKTCRACGITFESMPFQKYCSRKCGNKSRKNKLIQKHTNACVSCGINFKSKYKITKTCSHKCHTELLKSIQNQRVQNGTHKGWSSRNGASYPEKFFAQVLENNNIPYTAEKKVGSYYIDFEIGKIALEIDGGQHEWPERKAKDAKKDEYLSKNGYTVYRIKWHGLNPKKEETLTLMKLKVDKLLEFVKQFLMT